MKNIKIVESLNEVSLVEVKTKEYYYHEKFGRKIPKKTREFGLKVGGRIFNIQGLDIWHHDKSERYEKLRFTEDKKSEVDALKLKYLRTLNDLGVLIYNG